MPAYSFDQLNAFYVFLTGYESDTPVLRSTAKVKKFFGESPRLVI